MRDFPNQIIWRTKTHPKFMWLILEATHLKWHERKKFLIFVCLPFALTDSSFTLILRHYFPCIRIFSPMETEDQKRSQNPLGCQYLFGTAGTSCFMTGTTTRFLVFPPWDSHCWTTWTTTTLINPFFQFWFFREPNQYSILKLRKRTRYVSSVLATLCFPHFCLYK